MLFVISIPSGAIKRNYGDRELYNILYISIPSGAIKRAGIITKMANITYFNSFWCD